jgi:uncharacterized protein (TIGR02145 family)
MTTTALISSVTITLVFLITGCGQSFKEAKIGDQIWMSENLNVDEFRNGDPIPEAKTDKEWQDALRNKEPIWCYYDFDSANEEKYGKLYNWYAVIDPRAIAPEGWRIPKDLDWMQLIKTQGGVFNGKEFMMDFKGKNTSGFNAVPNGGKDINDFFDKGSKAYYWKLDDPWSGKYFVYGLDWDEESFWTYTFSKEFGLAVRCIKLTGNRDIDEGMNINEFYGFRKDNMESQVFSENGQYRYLFKDEKLTYACQSICDSEGWPVDGVYGVYYQTWNSDPSYFEWLSAESFISDEAKPDFVARVKNYKIIEIIGDKKIRSWKIGDDIRKDIDFEQLNSGNPNR